MTTPRRRVLLGAGLVVISVGSVQGSAALASTIFDAVDPPGVVAWRLVFGAIMLVLAAAALSPRGIGQRVLRRRSAREWGLILALGVAMAAMNVGFYSAVSTLPLGVAATLLFLGPFAVAVAGSRTWGHGALAVIALLGVVLVARPTGQVDPRGVAIGLLAGAALAAYTLLSRRLGSSGGLDGLALATTAAALLLSPVAIGSIGQPGPTDWGILIVLGALGVTLTFAADFLALRLAGTRVVSTLFSLDPVVGAVLGVAFLADAMTALQVLGILGIAGAGALTAATAEGAQDPAKAAPIGVRLR